MKINTGRFGTIEIDEGKIVILPEGLIGMAELHRFVILEHRTGSTLKWLQSIEDSTKAFVIANPFDFFPDYTIDLPEGSLELLGVASPETIALFVILTIRAGGREVTANLLAPVLVNVENRTGRQFVLDRPDLGTRHTIVSEEAFRDLRLGERKEELSGMEPPSRALEVTVTTEQASSQPR